MNERGSALPNVFPMPNCYLDELLPLLTPDEFVILAYTIRRAFAAEHRATRIVFAQYVSGTRDREGNLLDRGTGLSEYRIQRALSALTTHQLVLKTGEGNTYLAQTNLDRVDWGGLYVRHNKFRRSNGQVQAKIDSTVPVPPTDSNRDGTGNEPEPVLSPGNPGTHPPPACGSGGIRSSGSTPKPGAAEPRWHDWAKEARLYGTSEG